MTKLKRHSSKGRSGWFLRSIYKRFADWLHSLVLMITEPTARPKRIGVYGGKFDPPHIGHLICAEQVRERFHLDKILFVTSANPPHKKNGVSDAEDRHELVEAAVLRNCFFSACDIELRRDGPSYTVDTILELKEIYGDDVELYLIQSSEYLDPEHPWYLPKWHGAEKIFQNAHILIFPFAQTGQTIDQARAWGELIPQARLDYLDFCPSPPVSSTMIRGRIARGESVWYMVTTEVGRIIRRRRLYGYHEPRRCTICQKYGNLIASKLGAWKRRIASRKQTV